MNPIVLKDILLYAVRTWKGARSRVPDNQDRVRLVQLKEEMHHQTAGTFKDGPLMGCAYIAQTLCYIAAAVLGSILVIALILAVLLSTVR